MKLLKFLKFLFYLLFFLSIGVHSVPTSAVTVCDFIINSTTQKSAVEISSSTKVNLFSSSFIASRFVKVTEIKTLCEKAVFPKFTELNFSSSEEKKRMGLLYLDEVGELGIHPNGAVQSQENQKFIKNQELVDAWEVLHTAGVDDLANKVDDISFVQKYMDDFPDKNVAQEITDVGGYSKWSTGLNKLDNVLAKVDNLELPNLKGKIGELDDAAKIRFANDVGELSDDAIRQLEDNFGLLDEWKQIDALEEAAKASRKPDWLKENRARKRL